MSAKVGILVENVKEVCVGFDDKMLSCKPDLNPAQKLNFHLTTKTKEKWFNFFELHCGVSEANVSSLCCTSAESLVHNIHLCTDV